MTIVDYATLYVGIVTVFVFVILPILVLFAQGPAIIERFVDCIDEWKDIFYWLRNRRNK